MSLASRRFVLQGAVFGVACACAAVGAASAQTPPEKPPAPGQKYICPPCGCENDGKTFDAPGTCPAAGCGMTLIPEPTAAPKA
jgi:hypothetical protein